MSFNKFKNWEPQVTKVCSVKLSPSRTKPSCDLHSTKKNFFLQEGSAGGVGDGCSFKVFDKANLYGYIEGS